MSRSMSGDQSERQEHKAEDNAWYLLATLHDGPEASDDDEAWSKNRAIWNRYAATYFNDECRTRLVERGFELSIDAPLDPDELASLQEQYATRHRATGSKAPATLPRLEDGKIDLSGIEFERPLRWEGYLIPCELNMSGAKFKGTTFDGAIFLGKASFDGATFSGGTTFSKATFVDDADFASASYPGLADWISKQRCFTGTHSFGL